MKGEEYILQLKDGNSCEGVLIENDLITEKVWFTEEGEYVFECFVQEATKKGE